MTNPDQLQELLDAQSELQHKMPSPHPTDLYEASQGFLEDMGPVLEATDEDRKPAIDFIHWNVTALTDELHELLGEVGWKPWAKSRHINLEAARGELIDAYHFMANLSLVLGMDANEIMRRYHEKHAKNAKRQEEGYDGVSTKCPGCKRALDDEAVKCRQLEGVELQQYQSAYPSLKNPQFVICELSGGLFMTSKEA